MRRMKLLVLSGAVLAGSCLSLEATNRFYIQSQTLATRSTVNTVPVLADVDQDTYGYSVSLQYDAAKLAVTAVEPGAAATPLAPEFSEGTITTSPGRVFYGIVFDLSNPITKKLSPGTGREVLKLTIDVKATTASTTVLDLVNIPGDLPRLNVMANSNGDSVSPAPTLVDGTLTLSEAPELPVIHTVRNNSGEAGREFIVEGLNFDTGGLSATLCDRNAFVNLQPDKTLLVTAPYCETVNAWSALKICTSVGCVTEAQGFFYEGSEPTFIRGNANNDKSVDISDAVGILNDLFLGFPAPAPCRDALDTNDSGAVDLSDAIYLLNFLFQGGPRVEPPYPEAGTDPTADSLLDCKV